MKTLELKHLAPYLPYTLGFLHRDEIYQLMKLSIPYDQNPMWIEGWNGTDMISVFPEGCEPLLRPLSDLKKENLPEFLGENEFFLYESFIASIVRNNGINLATPYGLGQLLISQHFDVFGLIDKGLAIDINTITNGNN